MKKPPDPCGDASRASHGLQFEPRDASLNVKCQAKAFVTFTRTAPIAES
jgi:hypothetical protein